MKYKEGTMEEIQGWNEGKDTMRKQGKRYQEEMREEKQIQNKGRDTKKE